MTVEAKIPLNDLKVGLYNYACLYNVVNNPKQVFEYKMKVARNTITDVLIGLLKILLFVIFVAVAINTQALDLRIIMIILSVITGFMILLDLFYRQSIPSKKFKKLRFRFTYYIQCIVRDFYEIGLFRRYFGIKTSTLGLIYGRGRAEAYRNIGDWGYMIGEEYVQAIDKYNETYRDYRDYVNFDDKWHLCGESLSIINSGRATDVQSALAVMDKKAHMKRIEKIEQDKANRIASAKEREAAAVEAAKEREAAAVEASSAAVQSAANAREAADRERERLYREARDKINSL